MIKPPSFFLKILIFFFCFISIGFAQKLFPISKENPFKTPQKTLSYFLEKMERGNTNEAAKALNSQGLNESEIAQNKALISQEIYGLLKSSFPTKNFESLPQAQGKTSVLLHRGTSLVNQQYLSTEISLGMDQSRNWKFSPASVSSVLQLIKARGGSSNPLVSADQAEWTLEIQKLMPSWMNKRIFFLLNGQWLGLFLIILAGLIIVKISKNYLAKFVLGLVSKRIRSFEKLNQSKFLNPLGWAFLALIWNSSITFLGLPAKTLGTFLKIGELGLTFGLLFSAHYLVDVIARVFEIKAKETENKIDDLLVPLLKKGAKFLVIFIGIVAIGETLNLDMKGLLAGLGIGGLAFALAAKDTLGNIFGSLTVILDRPFQIGDWVMIDGKVEGTVEEVGLRSTRIRTFYDSLISVPNGQLTNIHIDNYGTRTYRRFTTRLGLEYDTPPEKIESFCEGVRQIILGHKYTRKDYFHVYFNNYADSALEILVYVFWQVPDWSTELQEKHRLLIDIKRLAKELDVGFAFPTRTLHLFNEQKESSKEQATPLSPLNLGKEEAGKIIKSPLSPDRPRSGEKEFKE